MPGTEEGWASWKGRVQKCKRVVALFGVLGRLRREGSQKASGIGKGRAGERNRSKDGTSSAVGSPGTGLIAG